MSLSRRELLTCSAGAAALVTVGTSTAAATLPSTSPEPGLSLPAAREGLGALVIDGEIVIFDAADFELEAGAEAVVIQPILHKKGSNGPQVRTIEGPTMQPLFWDRSATLAPLRDDAGRPTHYPIIYVLGRVVGRHPLKD